MHVAISLFLRMPDHFGLYPGNFEYYYLRLWMCSKSCEDLDMFASAEKQPGWGQAASVWHLRGSDCSARSEFKASLCCSHPSCTSIQRPLWDWVVSVCSWFHSSAVLFGAHACWARAGPCNHKTVGVTRLSPSLCPADTFCSLGPLSLILRPEGGAVIRTVHCALLRTAPTSAPVEQGHSERGETRFCLAFLR